MVCCVGGVCDVLWFVLVSVGCTEGAEVGISQDEMCGVLLVCVCMCVYACVCVLVKMGGAVC